MVQWYLFAVPRCTIFVVLNGKLGKPAYLENWNTTIPSLTAGESAFNVTFDWDKNIGVPGAFIIRNEYHIEFYLKTVTHEDVPGQGQMHFCAIHGCARQINTKRIVFSSLTRGPKHVGPILGGSSEYPYPRRGRTGRPPTNTDPNSERRLMLLMSLNIYVPRDERFGHLKMSDFLAYALKSIGQFLKPELEAVFDKTPNEFDSFEDALKLYEGGIELPVSLLENIRENIPGEILREIFRTDAERLLKFPVPQVIKEHTSAWKTDEEFAKEMLAGINPEFPPASKLEHKVYGDHTSKISKEHIEHNLSGLSVNEAIKNNKLFILDHHDTLMPYLRRINTTHTRTYASRTLLFLKDDGTLKPVAIELSLPNPHGDPLGCISKVYTPANQGVKGSFWLLAKGYVAVNDSGYHQLISHWLKAHAVIEPFVIATNRQLSVIHRIYKLLHPHFRDTMNINAVGRQILINAGGALESTVFPAKYSLEMSSKVYKNWVFPDQALPVDLIKRGMAVQDANSPHGLRLLIEDYPYAVDGLEIWSAINTWYPYGGYPPSRPSISHRFIPEEGNPEYEELKTNPEKAYLKSFNSQLLSVLGIALVEILSRHSTDEIYIGQRDTREWTEDAEVLKAFKKFEKQLKEIEETITRMNKDEKLKNRVGPAKVPYTLLYPSSEAGLTDQSTALLQLKREFAFVKPDFSGYYYICLIYGYSSYYADIYESYPKMRFWKEENDCCSWDGVTCNMKTGRVVALDLAHSWLQGPLRSNSSLFKLHGLRRINMAYNNFSFSLIPSEFGRLSRLTHLNLSFSMFSGRIPSEISFLTNLVSLSLSSFKNYDETSLLHIRKVDFANLIQNMTNLSALHLHQVDISSSLPESLANLSSLTSLVLGGCDLHGKFPDNIFQFPKLEVIYLPCNYFLTGFLPQFQLSSSLKRLTLDYTNFSGIVPNSIGYLKSMSHLALWNCHFVGTIPSSIWNLSELTFLDLSQNRFTGYHQLPSTLGNLAKLTVLWLESSQLNGEIPFSLGNLTQLEFLGLSNNNLSGIIEFGYFSRLRYLQGITLSSNSLSVTTTNINSELPKFAILFLASCNLSEFPEFLKTQDQLRALDLSFNRIKGEIPKWFWGIRNNKLGLLDLSWNELHGSLTVPPLWTSMSYFCISGNNLTGRIHPSLRKWTRLKFLDLSKNHFGGTIPQWLGRLTGSLEFLNLKANNFQGSIPPISTNGSMHNMMRILDLSHNQLQGKVPQSLINCSKLQVLNLGHNQISDTFPFWLQNLSELQILVLRSNNFFGPIWHPLKYLGFVNLSIIDLSFNHFSGSLPSEYFRNWDYMSKAPDRNKSDLISFGESQEESNYSVAYMYSTSMMSKGLDMELMKALTIFTSIDLSNNKFDGEIPSSIGDLRSLIVLNLSSNSFTGTIPSSLGNLTELESLDLSKNKLIGGIPQQLENLKFLEYLNMSQNQLTGPIPQGGQMETFSYSSFEGNPGLCGLQLSKKCENTDAPFSFHSKEEESESENGFTWKVVVLGYGCGLVVGLIFGHVTLSRRSCWFWRSFVGRYIYACIYAYL
ncbi:hypothetical protein FNV43_RR04928 [Rhamnella rubrinervis]|uniref:Lipoxygenase n=1 Tax=Rhamnella rubrinervis TaxID=2594499 RepID=A0A8K0HL58_9ROSA|nr:hypothetical protein FNV43_RR04928 [Rhamnella rubrinervis]